MLQSRFLFLLVVVFFASGFASCSSDDEEEVIESSGQLTFGDVSVKIYKIIVYYDKNPETESYFDLRAFQEGVDVTTEGNFTGDGHVVNANLLTKSAGLAFGKYEYGEWDDNTKNRVSYVGVSKTHSDGEGGPAFGAENSSCEVTINKSGNVYEITIKAKDSNGKKLNLSYKGSLSIEKGGAKG